MAINVSMEPKRVKHNYKYELLIILNLATAAISEASSLVGSWNEKRCNSFLSQLATVAENLF